MIYFIIIFLIVSIFLYLIIRGGTIKKNVGEEEKENIEQIKYLNEHKNNKQF